MLGHLVVRCFKRFDASFTSPPPKLASSATTSSYGADCNWYMDSDHITGELDKLILHRGRCEGGLYPFKASSNKLGLGVLKPSRSFWHHRLGHANNHVVQQVSHHSLLSSVIQSIMCVMPVSKANIISYHILGLAMYLLVLWNSCF